MAAPGVRFATLCRSCNTAPANLPHAYCQGCHTGIKKHNAQKASAMQTQMQPIAFYATSDSGGESDNEGGYSTAGRRRRMTKRGKKKGGGGGMQRGRNTNVQSKALKEGGPPLKIKMGRTLYSNDNPTDGATHIVVGKAFVCVQGRSGRKHNLVQALILQPVQGGPSEPVVVDNLRNRKGHYAKRGWVLGAKCGDFVREGARKIFTMLDSSDRREADVQDGFGTLERYMSDGSALIWSERSNSHYIIPPRAVSGVFSPGAIGRITTETKNDLFMVAFKGSYVYTTEWAEDGFTIKKTHDFTEIPVGSAAMVDNQVRAILDESDA